VIGTRRTLSSLLHLRDPMYGEAAYPAHGAPRCIMLSHGRPSLIVPPGKGQLLGTQRLGGVDAEGSTRRQV
jgi:hypothetical protein